MQYDFNLSANGGQRIEIQGRFFKYKSGSGLIRISTSKGEVVDLLPGQGVYGIQFNALTISDRSGQPNIGVILAGEFDFRDEQIPNTVKTVDCGKDFTLANQAFIGSDEYPTGSTSGNLQGISLMNPTASGKNAVLKAFNFNLTTGPDIQLVGGDIANQGKLSINKHAASKLIGGAASACGCGVEQMATGALATYAASGGVLMYTKSVTGDLRRVELKEPIVLKPGKSVILFFNKTIDGCGQVHFEWTEEPI
jgi:hypothetical protein